MPVNYNTDVNFSQNTHLYLMSKDRLIHIAEKFILHGNKALLKDMQGGVCIGLSTYYMANVRQGGSQQGEAFLLGLKELIHTIEMPIAESASPLVKVKLLAEKIHAKERLNRILTVIIDIQKRHFNSVNINHYIPDPYMWLDMLPDETAHHYIDRVKNRSLELNSNLKNAIWFEEFYIDLKARYFNHDIDSINNIKDNYAEVLAGKKYDYYIDSIKFTENNGIQTIKFKQKHHRHYYFLDIDYFFEHHIYDPAKYNAKYFELFTGNHMMIFSIENKQDKINYAFFDSNIGVFNFDSKEKFKLFLYSF